MTQGKLIKIFEEFAQQYSENFDVILFRDMWKERLQQIQYDLENPDEPKRVPENIRFSYNLKSVLSTAKVHQYIISNEHRVINLTYDELARKMLKTPKLQLVVSSSFKDSKAEYQKFLTDNSERIKEHQEKMRKKYEEYLKSKGVIKGNEGEGENKGENEPFIINPTITEVKEGGEGNELHSDN